MPEIECRDCGYTFDTEREHPAGPHADTTRCSSCGTQHHVPDDEEREETDEDAAVSLEGGPTEVHIHVHRE